MQGTMIRAMDSTMSMATTITERTVWNVLTASSQRVDLFLCSANKIFHEIACFNNCTRTIGADAELPGSVAA